MPSSVAWLDKSSKHIFGKCSLCIAATLNILSVLIPEAWGRHIRRLLIDSIRTKWLGCSHKAEKSNYLNWNTLSPEVLSLIHEHDRFEKFLSEPAESVSAVPFKRGGGTHLWSHWKGLHRGWGPPLRRDTACSEWPYGVPYNRYFTLLTGLKWHVAI